MTKVRLTVLSLACAGLLTTAGMSMAAGGSGTSSSTDPMDRGGTSGQNAPAMESQGQTSSSGIGAQEQDGTASGIGAQDQTAPGMGSQGQTSSGMGSQGQDSTDKQGHPSPDTMGVASTEGTPGAKSDDSQSISGEILSVKGEKYVVKDATGKEVNLHVDESTEKSGSLKKGDRIEAEVTADGHAVSLKKAQKESAH